MSTDKAIFQNFLDRMRNPDTSDLVRTIRSFILKISGEISRSGDSRKVQEFLTNTEKLIRDHPLWQSASSEELNGVGEALEKYVMMKIYSHVFGTAEADVEEDRELQNKIAALQQFVQPSHLDVSGKYVDEQSILLAGQELQKMSTFKAPRDKLICLLHCCELINNSMAGPSQPEDTNETPPGADVFLPLFIFVVIKTNPSQLLLNTRYIQRYRHESRLVSEQAYYFTNLLSVIAFLQNLTAASLSMNESSFLASMRLAYTKLNLPVPAEYAQAAEPVVGAAEANLQAVSLKKVEGMVSEFRFAFAELEDLRLGDVKLLLQEYKELVLRYVQLLRQREEDEAGRQTTAQEKLEGSKTSAVDASQPAELGEEAEVSLVGSLEAPSVGGNEPLTKVDDLLSLLTVETAGPQVSSGTDVDLGRQLEELEQSLKEGGSLL